MAERNTEIPIDGEMVDRTPQSGQAAKQPNTASDAQQIPSEPSAEDLEAMRSRLMSRRRRGIN
jgi:hypothetical protein